MQYRLLGLILSVLGILAHWITITPLLLEITVDFMSQYQLKPLLML